jgi:hypothetical protein
MVKATPQISIQADNDVTYTIPLINGYNVFLDGVDGNGGGLTFADGTGNTLNAIYVPGGDSGSVVVDPTSSLTLTHGVSLSNGNLTINNLSVGAVTLDGASTVANESTFRAEGPPGPFSQRGSFVLNGSLTVSNGSTANLQDAAVQGHGTVNIGAGNAEAFGNTVLMDAVLAGIHVNVGKGSELILQNLRNPGGAISFHGTISEAAGSTIEVYGAQTAVREIFHTATGTLDLLNKVGTQVASLQFAPGSREYTSISPNAQGQYATITTDAHAAHTLPTIFTH